MTQNKPDATEAERVRACKYCKTTAHVATFAIDLAAGKGFVVSCGQCFTQSDRAFTKAKAMSSWNTLHTNEIVR